MKVLQNRGASRENLARLKRIRINSDVKPSALRSAGFRGVSNHSVQTRSSIATQSIADLKRDRAWQFAQGWHAHAFKESRGFGVKEAASIGMRAFNARLNSNLTMSRYTNGPRKGKHHIRRSSTRRTANMARCAVRNKQRPQDKCHEVNRRQEMIATLHSSHVLCNR